MCIKPRPWTYVCPNCGWRKLVAPESDCLAPGEYFSACPQCGAEPLNREQPSAAEQLKLKIPKILRRKGF
jgi:predicted RNA-binding Zn-ribbon protein involved in translation (DUF1610 family)